MNDVEDFDPDEDPLSDEDEPGLGVPLAERGRLAAVDLFPDPSELIDFEWSTS